MARGWRVSRARWLCSQKTEPSGGRRCHGNPEDCLDECESEAPGYKTFVYGEIDWENNTYVNCYTKTFPWFEEVWASSRSRNISSSR